MPFSSSSYRETEERGQLAGGGLGRRLGARWRPWSEGKDRGRLVGSIPPSISGKEARREECNGGRRQQAAAAVVAPLRVLMATKEKRESEREPLGPYSLPWLGLGRSEVGCPRGLAAAGGGEQRSSWRRRCGAREEASDGWGGCGGGEAA